MQGGLLGHLVAPAHEQDPVGLGVVEPEPDVGVAAEPERAQRVAGAGRGLLARLVELAELLLADRPEQLGLGDGTDGHRRPVAGLEQQAGGGVQDLGTQALALPPPRAVAAGGGGTLRVRGHQALTGSGPAWGAGSAGPPSDRPIRPWRRRSGWGAHQLARPARRMNAGTSSARMRVASTTIASALPIPKSWMKLTSEVAKARNTTASRAAAAVTMPPVRSSPRATAATVSPVRSCSSLIRLNRNTS